MRYGTVDREFAMRLATCPPSEDGPVLMVNFMKYRQRASYADGGDHGVSGREADDRYAPLDVLRDIGAVVVYVGDVVDAAGGPDPTWDRVGIVRYPTRRSFIEMQSRQDFQDRHVHKDAGMEFTIVLTAVPADAGIVAADDSGVVRFVVWPEGSTPDDRPGEGCLLTVEGRIVGDGRRWSLVGVHHDNEPGGDAPDGVMVVRTRPMMDRLREVIDQWPQS